MRANGVRYSDCPATGTFRRVIWLARMLIEFEPDVIFAHSIIPSAYGRTAGWLFAQKHVFVTMLHSACQNDYNNRRFRMLEHFFLPAPDVVIGVTRAACENYRRMTRNAVHTAVSNNCVDTKRYSGREGPNHTKNVLLVHLARYEHYKNHEFSLVCTRSLITRFPEYSFKLIIAGAEGDSEYRTHLAARVQELGIQKEVDLSPARSDVPKLLATADICLMPSRWELISLSLLEYLASGAFILASDIDTFRFAARMPGVLLVSPDKPSEAADQLAPIKWMTKYERNLSDYEPAQISANHLRAVSVCEALTTII